MTAWTPDSRNSSPASATGAPRVRLTPRSRGRGSVLVPLTRCPGRVQVFKQVLAHRAPRLVSHAGHEWPYVLAGEREVVLRPGETAGFDTAEPHWFGPAGREAVEILHLFGPHGGRAVVRTGPAAAG
ncbi:MULTISPECIES: cupin domain-containing protein [unclassified Streptomyces]|uniref:cupin domain-containing protein n=1 Tax=unclassified Streptomyces TaxID=2593676 RepID=UPI000AEA58FD|nr:MULTISPECIES: cupin domain-containing protein [unclassified Streptomyces]